MGFKDLPQTLDKPEEITELHQRMNRYIQTRASEEILTKKAVEMRIISPSTPTRPQRSQPAQTKTTRYTSVPKEVNIEDLLRQIESKQKTPLDRRTFSDLDIYNIAIGLGIIPTPK